MPKGQNGLAVLPFIRFRQWLEAACAASVYRNIDAIDVAGQRTSQEYRSSGHFIGTGEAARWNFGQHVAFYFFGFNRHFFGFRRNNGR